MGCLSGLFSNCLGRTRSHASLHDLVEPLLPGERNSRLQSRFAHTVGDKQLKEAIHKLADWRSCFRQSSKEVNQLLKRTGQELDALCRKDDELLLWHADSGKEPTKIRWVERSRLSRLFGEKFEIDLGRPPVDPSKKKVMWRSKDEAVLHILLTEYSSRHGQEPSLPGQAPRSRLSRSQLTFPAMEVSVSQTRNSKSQLEPRRREETYPQQEDAISVMVPSSPAARSSMSSRQHEPLTRQATHRQREEQALFTVPLSPVTRTRNSDKELRDRTKQELNEQLDKLRSKDDELVLWHPDPGREPVKIRDRGRSSPSGDRFEIDLGQWQSVDPSRKHVVWRSREEVMKLLLHPEYSFRYREVLSSPGPSSQNRSRVGLSVIQILDSPTTPNPGQFESQSQPAHSAQRGLYEEPIRFNDLGRIFRSSSMDLSVVETGLGLNRSGLSASATYESIPISGKGLNCWARAGMASIILQFAKMKDGDRLLVSQMKAILDHRLYPGISDLKRDAPTKADLRCIGNMVRAVARSGRSGAQGVDAILTREGNDYGQLRNPDNWWSRKKAIAEGEGAALRLVEALLQTAEGATPLTGSMQSEDVVLRLHKLLDVDCAVYNRRWVEKGDRSAPDPDSSCLYLSDAGPRGLGKFIDAVDRRLPFYAGETAPEARSAARRFLEYAVKIDMPILVNQNSHFTLFVPKQV